MKKKNFYLIEPEACKIGELVFFFNNKKSDAEHPAVRQAAMVGQGSWIMYDIRTNINQNAHSNYSFWVMYAPKWPLSKLLCLLY